MKNTLAQAARLSLRLIPDSAVMPVIAPAPLRGMHWVAGSGLSRCWLGTFEIGKRREFARYVRPGTVVFDVGAQAGYYTMLASRLVGPGGVVVSVEPLPRNLANLRRHLELNHITNTRIIAAAAGPERGHATFLTEPTSYMGRLDAAGDLEVDVIALDDIAATVERPDVVKIDVEGGEFGVLAGATRILEEDRPVIFLATHGDRPHRDCCQLLESAAYRLSPLDSTDLDAATEVLAVPSA